jgi:hypothetical protein
MYGQAQRMTKTRKTLDYLPKFVITGVWPGDLTGSGYRAFDLRGAYDPALNIHLSRSSRGDKACLTAPAPSPQPKSNASARASASASPFLPVTSTPANPRWKNGKPGRRNLAAWPSNS